MIPCYCFFNSGSENTNLPAHKIKGAAPEQGAVRMAFPQSHAKSPDLDLGFVHNLFCLFPVVYDIMQFELTSSPCIPAGEDAGKTFLRRRSVDM